MSLKYLNGGAWAPVPGTAGTFAAPEKQHQRYTATGAVTRVPHTLQIGEGDLLMVLRDNIPLVEGTDFTPGEKYLTLETATSAGTVIDITVMHYEFSPNRGHMDDRADPHQTGAYLASHLEGSALFSEMAALLYPVGSIYLSVDATDPATLFGGEWVAWGSGRVPIGVDSTVSALGGPDKLGGSGSHTHTVSHNHGLGAAAAAVTVNSFGNLTVTNRSMEGYMLDKYVHVGDTTSGGGGSNEGAAIYGTTDTAAPATSTASSLPPCITCYMFKRIA